MVNAVIRVLGRPSLLHRAYPRHHPPQRENISAVEVEQQLLAMPEVIEAAVVPVPDCA
jgi:hypothetical protein